MRKTEKIAKPPILVANDVQWTQELVAAEKGTSQFKEIESRYGHEEIRSTLREETYSKCVYCESYIDGVSFPHIEHILPKHSHTDLTFEWDNLTLACPACNTYKGIGEPTNNNFIHPYADAPEDRFHFIGSLIAPTGSDIAAKNMVNWLRLNRGGLVIDRADIVLRVIGIYLEAITLPLEARREFIDLSIEPLKAPNARFSRVAECAATLCEEQYHDALVA